MVDLVFFIIFDDIAQEKIRSKCDLLRNNQTRFYLSREEVEK